MLYPNNNWIKFESRVPFLIGNKLFELVRYLLLGATFD